MIRIANLTKRYEPKNVASFAMDNLSIDIVAHTFVTLLGPSGCGKTTLLRCIAGLETPDDGEVAIDDQIVFSSRKKIHVPVHKRRIGMVFQSYAIWPHMTVFQNVAFPLEVQRISNIERRVKEVLAMVGLDMLADRYASRLSGGQQQRVAFARAIVAKPSVLLLDEPLSNLDAELRHQMCKELRHYQEELGVTAIYVTHDQAEALSLSDRIVIMRNGRVVEMGTPQDLYYRPREQFTSQFIGGSNMLWGVCYSEIERIIEGPFGKLKTAYPIENGPISIFIRPEKIRLSENDAAPGSRPNTHSCTVASSLFSGSSSEFELSLTGTEQACVIRCVVPGPPQFRRGERVWMQIDPMDVQIVRPDLQSG